MRNILLASVLIVGTCGTASAGETILPVCARPAVLDHVAAALRQVGRSMALESGAVGEISTGPGDLVYCAVRAHRLAYDTNRYAYLPLDQAAIVQYTIELRHNGIFLHVNYATGLP